jgi:CheY-like chemotaxis protein
VKPRVLFVDDEPNVLEAHRRMLGRRYAVETAVGGRAGLERLSEGGTFAVIVSDMQMPGMNGIQFLKQTREASPDSVRIMLTGMSDQKTATDAVNEGNIFRFVTKPCPPETMNAVLTAGVRQHQLLTAEKELLQNTLKESIQVLVDILSLVNPVAFSRAMRLKHYAVRAAEALGLGEPWRFEVAALLSQIGFVTVPGDVLERMASGDTLTDSEQKMVDDLPGMTSHLIARIPRLEEVAEIIAGQPAGGSGGGATPPEGGEVQLGSEILRAATALDGLLLGGDAPADALAKMIRSKVPYDPRIVRVLGDIDAPSLAMVVMPMKIRDLQVGMALAEDVLTLQGMLVVGKGQEVTEALRRRLANFRALGNIDEPLRIYVPREGGCSDA